MVGSTRKQQSQQDSRQSRPITPSDALYDKLNREKQKAKTSVSQQDPSESSASSDEEMNGSVKKRGWPRGLKRGSAKTGKHSLTKQQPSATSKNTRRRMSSEFTDEEHQHSQQQQLDSAEYSFDQEDEIEEDGHNPLSNRVEKNSISDDEGVLQGAQENLKQNKTGELEKQSEQPPKKGRGRPPKKRAEPKQHKQEQEVKKSTNNGATDEDEEEVTNEGKTRMELEQETSEKEQRNGENEVDDEEDDSDSEENSNSSESDSSSEEIDSIAQRKGKRNIVPKYKISKGSFILQIEDQNIANKNEATNKKGKQQKKQQKKGLKAAQEYPQHNHHYGENGSGIITTPKGYIKKQKKLTLKQQLKLEKALREQNQAHLSSVQKKKQQALQHSMRNSEQESTPAPSATKKRGVLKQLENAEKKKDLELFKLEKKENKKNELIAALNKKITQAKAVAAAAAAAAAAAEAAQAEQSSEDSSPELINEQNNNEKQENGEIPTNVSAIEENKKEEKKNVISSNKRESEDQIVVEKKEKGEQEEVEKAEDQEKQGAQENEGQDGDDDEEDDDDDSDDSDDSDDESDSVQEIRKSSRRPVKSKQFEDYDYNSRRSHKQGQSLEDLEAEKARIQGEIDTILLKKDNCIKEKNHIHEQFTAAMNAQLIAADSEERNAILPQSISRVDSKLLTSIFESSDKKSLKKVKQQLKMNEDDGVDMVVGHSLHGKFEAADIESNTQNNSEIANQNLPKKRPYNKKPKVISNDEKQDLTQLESQENSAQKKLKTISDTTASFDIASSNQKQQIVNSLNSMAQSPPTQQQPQQPQQIEVKKKRGRKPKGYIDPAKEAQRLAAEQSVNIFDLFFEEFKKCPQSSSSSSTCSEQNQQKVGQSENEHAKYKYKEVDQSVATLQGIDQAKSQAMEIENAHPSSAPIKRSEYLSQHVHSTENKECGKTVNQMGERKEDELEDKEEDFNQKEKEEAEIFDQIINELEQIPDSKQVVQKIVTIQVEKEQKIEVEEEQPEQPKEELIEAKQENQLPLDSIIQKDETLEEAVHSKENNSDQIIEELTDNLRQVEQKEEEKEEKYVETQEKQRTQQDESQKSEETSGQHEVKTIDGIYNIDQLQENDKLKLTFETEEKNYPLGNDDKINLKPVDHSEDIHSEQKVNENIEDSIKIESKANPQIEDMNSIEETTLPNPISNNEVENQNQIPEAEQMIIEETLNDKDAERREFDEDNFFDELTPISAPEQIEVGAPQNNINFNKIPQIRSILTLSNEYMEFNSAAQSRTIEQSDSQNSPKCSEQPTDPEKQQPSLALKSPEKNASPPKQYPIQQMSPKLSQKPQIQEEPSFSLTTTFSKPQPQIEQPSSSLTSNSTTKEEQPSTKIIEEAPPTLDSNQPDEQATTIENETKSIPKKEPEPPARKQLRARTKIDYKYQSQQRFLNKTSDQIGLKIKTFFVHSRIYQRSSWSCICLNNFQEKSSIQCPNFNVCAGCPQFSCSSFQKRDHRARWWSL